MNEKEAAGKSFTDCTNDERVNNFWRVQMKKSLVWSLMLILICIGVFGFAPSAEAVDTCPECGGTNWVKGYVSIDNSRHSTYKCSKDGTARTYYTEAHYVYYYVNRNNGTHNGICICGKVMSTGLSHTWGSYIQISNTQCRRTCTATSCGATQTVNHNFVDGICSYCGASNASKMVSGKPTSEVPLYYKLENTSTNAVTVTVELFGPKVFSSASNPARKISFTDSVPAGTIRYYFVYTRGSGSSRRISFGYKDSTETTGHTLAIIMQDYRDNNKNLSFQMNGNNTYNIAFGNEVGKWTSTTATGSTISHQPAISGTTYLYTALNSNEKDYSYNGFNGKITSSHPAPTSLIAVSSHADASLPYGKVSLSYEMPHEHSWSAWATTTAATCTTAGVKTRTCSGCSQKETQAISALEHSYTLACPTCKEANVKCSRCGVLVTSHTCTIATPSVTLKANGSTYTGAWTNQSVVATLSAANATSYQYSNDGTNWLTASSLSMNGTTGTITFSGDRNNTVYFRSVLTSSIVSSKTAGSVIKIDKTAPTVTLSSSSVIAGTTVTATLSDTASGVNGWQVTTSSTTPTSGWTSITATTSTKVTYTPSSAGTYYVWTKDAAGNVKSATLTVSQVPVPTVALKVNGSTYSGAWTNQNVIATLSATNATSYQYSTDGTNWLTASSLSMSGTTGTITFSGDRNNTVYFRTVVTSSIVSSKTSGSTIKIDKTSPAVTLSSSSVTAGTAVTITLSDAASGVNGWQVTTSSSASTSGWTSITATASTTVTYTPSSVGTYYVWVRDAAGNMKFTTLAVGQATPPTITMGQISTSNINWEGWLLQGDAYVDSEGNLVCSSANSGAYKWFLVDGNKWTIELSYMVTTTGDKQGAYMNSAYFTDTFAAATAQNSYTGNGWASSATTSYKTSQWTGLDGYGPDVKYVRIYIGYNTTHTSVPVKYKPPKFSSGIEENYVGVRIVATANSGSLSSLKYLWSKSTSGVTESQITNVTSTNQVVYPPYGAKGTYCLWVLAQNSNGGKVITKTDTYTIDNPEIELSLGGNAGKATRYVNAYIFNQENLLTNPSIRVANKGTTTSSSYSSGPVGSVESATSSFYGSKAFLLKKTGTNYQWHGIQSAHDFFGNLAANTYVVVSSNYNTTAAAGQTYFTSNALYNSSWKSACSQTAVSRQNRIYADGKTHHTHDIIKTNAAITESTSIIGSGMPDWGYSNQVGTMTVDGIQWFVITDFNDGISVKKYAYGDKEITYFRNGGTTFTDNGFTATQNGIYTVYTITDNGVERVRTIEVTGIDKAQPDTTITNSGSSVSTDPSFATGLNGLKVYNNTANGKVSLTRVEAKDAPNTSSYAMHIKTNGEAQPGHGGFTFEHVPTADQQYVIKLVAKIPTGYSINFGTNPIGSHTAKWMTPITGTGDWETYLFYVKAGSSGTFSSTNYFYLTGGSTATESAPVEWDIAYANAYSTTAIAWTNKNVTITGKAQDTGDGIVAYGFNYSDVFSANVTAPTSWTTITATTSEVSATTTADKNGAYYFFAKDANGNISKTATYVERIDKVSPVAGTMTMKLGSSTGSDYTSGIRTKENVYISLVNGSDALSGHKSTTYQVTGANTVAAGTTAATTLTNNGISTIIVTTTDNAGNTASRTYTVIIAGDPILMSETKENVETNKYILGNSTITQRREDISIISIEDSVPDTLPSGAWDVSKNKDKSVYAWLTVNANNSAKYDLHIAGYGSVIASRGEYLFANYTNCTEIQGLSNLNTAIVANMASMFYGCSSLTSLDLSSFNTSNVTNMNSMFYGCSGLTSLDLKNFDTTNVTTIGAMFHECTGLTSLDVSSFNTSNVTNMDGAFYKCSGLKSFDLANFDTSKVTDMSWMFAWCGGVKQFNLSNFNTTNVTNMRYMFEGCSSLLDIDLSNFSTSKVTNMAGMFLCCYSLKSLPTGLDLINTGITTNTSTSSGYAQMFRSCTSLTSITVNSKYIGYQMFSGCNKVTDITITSNVQGVYNEGTGTPSGAFKYTGDGLLKTTLNSSSSVITKYNYDWTTDKREFNVVETDPSFFDQIVIDTTAPTISDIIITSDGYKVTITATIEDPKASSEIDGIGVDVSATRYAVTQTNTQPAESSSDWKTSNVVTTSFYGTGYVWILAKDALGNTRVASATTKIVIKNYKDSDNNYYSTLADAFSSAATGTTITVLQNTTDSALATLTAKTMTLDLNGKTITKTGSGIAVASSSKLIITDNAGTAGKIVSTVSSISNLITNKGYLTIVNGTISGVGTSTIYSEGTLTLGTLDGEVSITVPTIQGGEYAVNAVNGFNFYDGILKGTTVAYSGDIVDIEPGYDKVSGTEGSYKTAYIAIVDRLAPVGTITLAGTYYTKDNDDYVNTNTVTINLTAADNISSQENIKVALINENNYDKTKPNNEITWQKFTTTKTWQSSSGDGRKRVYVIFKDEAGNQTVYFAE